MAWPEATDYNEAIQNPAICFRDPDLQQGRPAVNALGWPLPCAGNFASVYEVFGPDGIPWAVKCFTREVRGRGERYHAISTHLRQAKLPFMVDFEYLEEGILVRGSWYPVVKMRWVEGLTLNDFLKGHVDRPQVLERLAYLWVKLARELRRAGIAHADLQHGNVLLVPGGKSGVLSVRLIDYDGMYVPALADSKSGEVGHPNYQHPDRAREGVYDAEVDRFPHLVIYTALRALLAGGRDLWEKHDTGDNLLFREQDFKDPASSDLFRELWQSPDPGVRDLTTRLARACQGKIADAPLLSDLLGSNNGTPAPSPALPARPLPGRREADGAKEQRSPSAPAIRGLGLASLALACAALGTALLPGFAALSLVLSGLGLLLAVVAAVVVWNQSGKAIGFPLTASAVNGVALLSAALLAVPGDPEPQPLARRPDSQAQLDPDKAKGGKARPDQQAPKARRPSSSEVAEQTRAQPEQQTREKKVTENKSDAQAAPKREQGEDKGKKQDSTFSDYRAAEEKRKQEEAEERKRAGALKRQKREQEEARREAEAKEAKRLQDEEDAARKLKQALVFLNNSLDHERNRQPVEARQSLKIAHKRFQEIIELYPMTQAAAECRGLLEKHPGQP
jgi:hypothetical protein